MVTYIYGTELVKKDGEYPLFDGQGSERTVTNSSQTVTGTLTQDGFGNTVATTGSSTNPYMYAATSGYMILYSVCYPPDDKLRFDKGAVMPYNEAYISLCRFCWRL